MFLQLPVLIIRDRDVRILRLLQFLQNLHGCHPGKTLFVRRIADQGFPLDLCLRGMQKDPQITEACIVIGIHDIRQSDTDFVDQLLVLKGIGDHNHPLCQITPVKLRAVPGEDHGGIFHFPLFHAGGKILQNSIVAQSLLSAFKKLLHIQGKIGQIVLCDSIDRLVLRVPDTVSDDRVHCIQISGHEGGRHFRIIRIHLQNFPRRLLAVFRKLHISIVIGYGQALVL